MQLCRNKERASNYNRSLALVFSVRLLFRPAAGGLENRVLGERGER